MFTGFCVVSAVIVGLSNCGCTFGVAFVSGCVGYTLSKMFLRVEKEIKNRL